MTCISARIRDVLATIGDAGPLHFGVHFSHARADGKPRILHGRSQIARRTPEPILYVTQGNLFFQGHVLVSKK